MAVSGWTIDPISGLPKNDEAVMKAYFDVHVTARYFKTKPLPYRDNLYYLWEGKTATGLPARGIRSTLAEAHVVETENEPDTSTSEDGQLRKRQTDSPISGGRKHQRQNEREVSSLREELKRGNDTMAAQLAERTPIKSAIAVFDAGWQSDFDMAAQVRVLDVLQRG